MQSRSKLPFRAIISGKAYHFLRHVVVIKLLSIEVSQTLNAVHFEGTLDVHLQAIQTIRMYMYGCISVCIRMYVYIKMYIYLYTYIQLLKDSSSLTSES